MPHSHPIQAPTVTVPSMLAHEFADAFADGMTAMHVGPNLTCTEVEALAAVLDAFDGADAARMWVEEHQTAGDCLIDHGETAEDDDVPGWEDEKAPEGKAAAPADGDDQDDEDDDEWDDGMVPVRMGITCAEACVFHIPAVVRIPPELAAGVREAVEAGRADDWGDDMHPAMAELYDWLEGNRDAWENQLDMGVHTQDGEDLEIRSVEPE
ncbi:hypothetical protein [Actinacidiphila sp. bgisy160]|uniref:hypothetical protein n=1 Tax=Actinacidiphila sp. bgisy160 TaxID=3413796 RepID=UPI003D703E77